MRGYSEAAQASDELNLNLPASQLVPKLESATDTSSGLSSGSDVALRGLFGFSGIVGTNCESCRHCRDEALPALEKKVATVVTEETKEMASSRRSSARERPRDARALAGSIPRNVSEQKSLPLGRRY